MEGNPRPSPACNVSANRAKCAQGRPRLDIDTFIDKWSQARGGAERANYQMFLSEFCQTIGVPSPDPASHDTRSNDYVFERGVPRRESEGTASTLRIDLYKRGCFILEAKQSRAHQRDDQPRLFTEAEAASTAAGEGRWDTLMRNARKQAEDYVFRLPADHVAPPFILVCDVGFVFEVYADFSGSGRAYSHFPDRKGFRVRLEDLRNSEVVERLKAIWTDPQSLDPTRKAARVTRQIAERLAEVSKRLEKKHPPEEVAHFLMRCIFTMFAEDTDLLPKGRFTALLEDCLDGPGSFAPLLEELWRKMDAPNHADRFYSLFKTHLRWFNGNLFHDARAFPMSKEEIGELLAASRHDWRFVEPAIFGTLVEQALEPGERRKLGAHYTPRSYVERLVEVTVMEPLRADWNAAQLKAGDARERDDLKAAVAAIRAFHHQLCTTRVLDPACGTGNFLYVSLELMKRLEGDVLETLAELGQTESIGFETVDPHQFLGIELNVRAAAIAELVLWIGYLQQHYRNSREHPAEPILKAFHNIQQKDAVLTWDGYPELQFEMRGDVSSPSRSDGEGDREAVEGSGVTHGKDGGPDLSQRPPSRLARRRVHRRQPAVHRWQGPALADDARLCRSAVVGASAHERERRFRHVLVGPGGRAADPQEDAPAPLRPRHHQLDQPGVPAPGDGAPPERQGSDLDHIRHPGPSVDQGDQGQRGGADCDDSGAGWFPRRRVARGGC